GDMGTLSQVRARLLLDVCGGAGAGPDLPRFEQPAGRIGQGQREQQHLPAALFRDDLLHDRFGLRLPKALARRHWQVGSSLLGEPLRLHPLDWACYLVVFLPRRAAGMRGERMEPDIRDELQSQTHEPLLPIEMKLILGSLLLGASLLGVLWWVSSQYFG